MSYFFDTIETIPDGVGFQQFGALHLIWLFWGIALIMVNCFWYRKLGDNGRRKWRTTVALLIVADEVFKVVMLLVGGRYSAEYLPLHLCSINIFIIAIHARKPTQLLSGFLYTICIPGAAAALLFPSWTSLPLINFMHVHSFTVHIMLIMYPIVLFTAGELTPSFKQLHKYLLLLITMAVIVYFINIILETNFMFLMYAEEGNPLYVFQQMWGNHLYGYPLILFGVLFVMYLPLIIYEFKKRRSSKKKTAQ